MALNILKFPLDHKLTLPNEPVSFLHCKWIEDGEFKLCDEEICFSPPFSISPVKSAEVHEISCLTNCDSVKPKIELILNVNNFECNYIPGDTIGILPTNPISEVDHLIELLNLNEKASKYFKIEILSGTTKKNAAVPKYIPEITTVKHLLSKCLEIRAPVKKLFLRSLGRYTQDESEKRRLEELSSREGSDEYNKYLLSENVSLLDLLKLFKSCKPPFSLLLEHLPGMKVRVYSIASSPLVDNKLVRIVVTVVENKNGSKGVCSGYLHGMLSNSQSIEDRLKNLNIVHQESHQFMVPLFFRQPNNFRYPENTSCNHILIGPGSGVAPFIGFLEHKRALKKLDKVEASNSVQTWLFFGCRNENDFIYRKKMNEFLAEGIVTKLFVSFSRSSKEDSSPKYVQDNIVRIKEEFIDLLMNNDTNLFICGDAQNMVKDVLSTIKSCLQQVRDADENEADAEIKHLTKSGKIITDAWI